MNLKKAVSLIISSIWCEESARELNGISDNDLEEISTYLKIANSAIERKYINDKGVNQILEMSYNLIEIFNEISYLSIENQNKVKEYVKSIRT